MVGLKNKLNNTSIAFVILSWQSAHYLTDCLGAVCALANDYRVSVFLYDNGSSDGSAELAEGLLSGSDRVEYYQVFRSEQNIGTTRSRNILLKMVPANTNYICILDSDTRINSAAIEQLISALGSDERIMIAAPRMFNAQLIEQRSVKRFPTIKLKLMKGSPCASMNRRGEALESYPFAPDGELMKSFKEAASYASAEPPVSADTAVYPVDYAISACWLLKREALDIIGYLDERIFYAPEDVDYCARVREAGYQVVLASDASIYHYTQRISKRKLISRMNLHHVSGLIYYFVKHRGLKHYL